jgi:outer membrane autotransporter protein
VDLSLIGAVRTTVIDTPAYREAAPAAQAFASLAVAGAQRTSARTELGMGFAIPKTGPLSGAAQVGWAHNFEQDFSMRAAMLGPPAAAFSVEGASPDDNALFLRAGMDFAVSNRFSIGGRVEGERSNSDSEVAVSLNGRARF